MEAGKIIIKTEIDSSGVDKGLYDVEKTINEIEQRIGEKFTEEQRKQMETQLGSLNDVLQELDDKMAQYKELTSDKTVMLKSDVEEASRLKGEIQDIVKLLEQMTGEEITIKGINDSKEDLFDIKNSINDIGKQLKSTVKRVISWGLAIFGIRSAYMAVRSAISTISNDDKQLKADIDYMKNAIAYTLEPVVRRIVELAKQLLFYIGWLIKQWTGHNIFENANKSLKNTVGSAKELKKQLAGFDEMNVLSDDSGGGGATTPSFDLSAIDKIEPPQWLVTIRDIGQWVIDHWEEVVFALLLTKLFIDLITGNWIGVVIDFLGLLVVAFFKLKDAVAVVFESLFEIWALFVAYITTKWVELKEAWAEFTAWLLEKWLDFVEWITNKWNNFTTWISNTVKKIGAFFSNLWQGIKDAVAITVQWVKDKFSSIVSFFSGLINKIISLFKTIGTKVGDAIGGAFKSVINGVLKAIENILNFPIRSINKLIDVINAVPGIDISTLPTFKLPRLAKGGIVNLPGKGVPIGGLAKTGEVSPEGVIPLTDSQQMELLGQSIGKFVTINATIPVYAYNRVVDRQIKRIKAEDEFAGNR